MTDAPIAVTGSTGAVGGRVARLLAARLGGGDPPLRLLVRDASRAPALPCAAGPADVRVAPYDDGDAARRALAGVEVLFMVSGSESLDRVSQHRTVIDAAADAGVRHLVYTSFLGAAPDAVFTLARDHHATEAHLAAAQERTGMAWTALRDGLYADFLPAMVGEDGVLRGPAGDGRVAAVAQDDVADAATAVLLAAAGPGGGAEHAGRTYDLTGPQALTLHEVAETITRVTGRPARYEPETLEEAFASRAVYGAPRWQVEAWVSTYTAMAAGQLDAVSPAVEELTGHPARTLEQVLTAGRAR
ncbi:SDR family oxidoreductase [Streptomyces sp. NP160]|uniref:SDR family oxidoreductase n=1 Tax=Streptomyces sp. NP160 TaxID=2586637 RepID=UPI0011181CB6|nr:SDR family oxidoreductase [Streptomyces sp. NP160]TNM59699.1 SDR family oxidoreductase [Streptomyces sp. NP160]